MISRYLNRLLQECAKCYVPYQGLYTTYESEQTSECHLVSAFYGQQ